MKRIIFAIVAILIAMSMLVLPIYGETTESLEDGGFEAGIGNASSADGQSIVSQSDSVYCGGSASLKCTGRSNKWGAVEWNVTDYIQAKGDGNYFCTLYITGNFSGSVRPTLHVYYADNTDVYHNIAVMTSFTQEAWTYVGADAEGKALPMGVEDWSKDYADWEKVIKGGNVTKAFLYFWIEGDDFGDVYIDNINFWHESDTPVEFTVSESPKLPTAGGEVVTVPLDEDTDDTAPSNPMTTEKETQKPADTTPAEKGSNNGLIIGICAAVIVVLAVVAILIAKKKKT